MLNLEKNNKSFSERLLDSFYIKSVQKFYKGLTYQVIIFQILIMLIQIGFLKSGLLISTFFFLLEMSYFLFASTEEHLEFCWKTIKVSGTLYCCSLLAGVCINSLHPSSAAGQLATRIVLLIIFVGVSLGAVVVFMNESIKESLETIQSIVPSERILDIYEKSGVDDIQLGIDKETKKPIILRFKDRFLHMLILGPTGSGKTSQTIIPMINQDIRDHKNSGVIVIEPKGDLAEKVWAMGVHYERDVMYFNPALPDCPYFNPLFGDESDVIENIVTTFRMLNSDSPSFFLDQSENLLRKAVLILKRLRGNDATLLELNTLVWNTNNSGETIVREFLRAMSKRHLNKNIAQENEETASWFLNDYFTGSTGERTATKSYEHCSGVRTQISKLVSNKYLRKVLNPPPGIGSEVDFDKALATGSIIAISTNQGKLGSLGGYLGYFVILQLESAVFRRDGNENTRIPCYLYIDEFQEYANPGFARMLTQGRSYRVASHLATQNRALIGMGRGQEGKDFIELVSTNARNVIVYPGGNKDDAKYYSEQFGEIEKKEVQKGISRQKFNPMFGLDIKAPTISERYSEKKEARFTASDIIYREFGEITYCIIKNNSIKTPGVAQIQYIPKDLNDKLDKMVDEFNESQKKKIEAEEMEYNEEISPHPEESLNLAKSPDITDVPDFTPILGTATFEESLDIPTTSNVAMNPFSGSVGMGNGMMMGKIQNLNEEKPDTKTSNSTPSTLTTNDETTESGDFFDIIEGEEELEEF